MNRRQLIKLTGASATGLFLSGQAISKTSKPETKFRYCLNTSTISGQDPGLLRYIEIAGRAGYNGIELWIRDIQKYMDDGNSLKKLKKHIDDQKIKVESAIGFAPWLSGDENESRKGFEQMKSEMEIMAALGCERIAAPAAGVKELVDLFRAGEKYSQLLELGRSTGVMPQLEFWGASPALFHIGQSMMICALTNDPDARMLSDVYHMFRGGSGFESLDMINGKMIEVFHMNDFPADIPRGEQTDADRVYPGDGVAPMRKIFKSLDRMGGTKVLSLELFNRDYWKQDAFKVAETGLAKMKVLVNEVRG